MHQTSTTFREHIEILATESPYALILEWGRRLELAVRTFLGVVGVSGMSWRNCGKALRNEPLVGDEVSFQINRLRIRRNVVAHEQPKGIAPDEAIQFAREAEKIVWFLGRARDIREGVNRTCALSSEQSCPTASQK